jgi:hypothetical protein
MAKTALRSARESGQTTATGTALRGIDAHDPRSDPNWAPGGGTHARQDGKDSEKRFRRNIPPGPGMIAKTFFIAKT